MSTSAHHPSSLATDDWIVSLAMNSSFTSGSESNSGSHQRNNKSFHSCSTKRFQHKPIPFETIMPRSGTEALLRCCGVFCGAAGGGFGYESIRGASSSDQSSTSSERRERRRRRRKRLKSSARRLNLDESGTTYSECDSTAPQSDHVGVPRTIRIDACLSPKTPETTTGTTATASTSLESPNLRHSALPNSLASAAREASCLARANHCHPRSIMGDPSVLNQFQKPIPEGDSTSTMSSKRRSQRVNENTNHKKIIRRTLAICLGTLAMHVLLLVAPKIDTSTTTTSTSTSKVSIPELEPSQPVFGGVSRDPPSLESTKPSYKYKHYSQPSFSPEQMHVQLDPPSPSSPASPIFTTNSPFCKAFFNFEPTTKTVQMVEPSKLLEHAVNEMVQEFKNALVSYWARTLNKLKRLMKHAQHGIVNCVKEQCI